ncbi:MAG: preprotein translocase subunit SecG [Bacteroidaceae bacterium]|nr:preprotein translocase subunit SecG [Bacteroidaceae bacterium]
MYSVLIVIIVILALLLSFLVTIQNSKGGGLAAGFSSSNQIMGVRKTTDFLEKSTWTLMGCIVVLSIATAFIAKPRISDEGSVLLNEATEQMMTNPTQSPIYDVPSADEIPTLPQENN